VQQKKDKPVRRPELTEAEKRSRSARNIAIGFGVVLFVALIYVVTLVKLTHAPPRPQEQGVSRTTP
jgi:hypothetical protein